jgi:two-component system response regulator (stage 0 sporulation protein F)
MVRQTTSPGSGSASVLIPANTAYRSLPSVDHAGCGFGSRLAPDSFREVGEMEHILVVDDDEAILRVVVTTLRNAGYAVSTATNGQEALTIMEQVHPAVVVMDLSMPVMDGPAFARILHQRGVAPPLIVVSAAVDGEAQAATLQASCYLPKPFDPLELLEDIVQTLRRRSVMPAVPPK